MGRDWVGGQSTVDWGLQLVFVPFLYSGVLILLQSLRCLLSVPKPICLVAREPNGYSTSHNTNEHQMNHLSGQHCPDIHPSDSPPALSAE